MNNERGRLRMQLAASIPARLIAVALLTVALAACTTAAPTATPTAVPVPTPSPTAAPTLPASTPTLAPTPAATVVAGDPACTPADLKASHGLVEGAAGSRLTEVILVSAIACSVDAFPALGLRDASGDALVGAASSGPGRIELGPGAAYSSNVRLANWCAPEPAFPLQLEIIIGGDELAVTGTSFPEEGDLPPCNGTGGPILEATAWAASP